MATEDDRKREKERLRQLGRAARCAVSAEEARRAADAVACRLVGCDAVRSAAGLAAYVATDGEIDTGPVLAWAATRCLPVLLPRWGEARGLELAYAGTAPLRPGRWGIPEPDGTPALEGDGGGVAILVPGVAFDPAGWRLGRGGGWYDRLLAGLPRARRIGVAYAAQMLADVPHDAWDVRMDMIVTETGLHGVATPTP